VEELRFVAGLLVHKVWSWCEDSRAGTPLQRLDLHHNTQDTLCCGVCMAWPGYVVVQNTDSLKKVKMRHN